MSSGNNIEILKETLTISDAIASINKLEKSQGLAASQNTVKWKSYVHQVVVESDAYFYKVYEAAPDSSLMFDHMVREALACAIQQLGIEWRVVSFEKDGKVFDFEQRQKLEVATPEHTAFENILVSMSNTYSKVEEMLGFNEILKQLKRKVAFSAVSNMKISRMCINKYEDYAFYDGEAVLLDDADFYIAFVDGEGNVLDVACDEDVDVEVAGKQLILRKLTANCSPKGNQKELLDAPQRMYHGWYLTLKKQDALSDVGRASKEIIASEHEHIIKKNDNNFVNFVELLAKTSNSNKRKQPFCVPETNSEGIVYSQLQSKTETELYEQLDAIDAQDVWVLTSYNPEGEILRDFNFCVWSSHMKTITAYYPNVSKLTTIFLTQEFCECYLNEIFKPRVFSGQFETTLRFSAPTIRNTFPKRRTFRKFLLKFAKEDSDMFNFILVDERKAHGEDVAKHCNCYSDSSECMVCDFDQVCESVLRKF